MPDQVADLLRREREVPPNVRKEKKKQMDRDRIALKRLQEKEKVLENVRYNLGGKTRSPDVARKVARHFTRDISEPASSGYATPPTDRHCSSLHQSHQSHNHLLNLYN